MRLYPLSSHSLPNKLKIYNISKQSGKDKHSQDMGENCEDCFFWDKGLGGKIS